MNLRVMVRFKVCDFIFIVYSVSKGGKCPESLDSHEFIPVRTGDRTTRKTHCLECRFDRRKGNMVLLEAERAE